MKLGDTVRWNGSADDFTIEGLARAYTDEGYGERVVVQTKDGMIYNVPEAELVVVN